MAPPVPSTRDNRGPRPTPSMQRRLLTPPFISTAVRLGFAVALLAPSTASALEPLNLYLEAGRRASAEAQETAATDRQRRAEVAGARAALYPRLEARGSYTRNQYEI